MKKIYEYPIDQIDDSNRVVIYGAGKLGKTLLKQLNEKEKKVVAFIDLNYKAKVNVIDKIPILGLESVFQYVDCTFVIALSDTYEACRVKEKLISRGIKESRIFLGKKRGFLQDSDPEELIKFYRRNLEKEESIIYLFSLAEHGNTGDYLIGYAAEKFFDKFFSDKKLIGITTAEWFQLKHFFAKVIRPSDIVCINGGGFFGTLRGDDTEYKDIVESFPYNIKIFLPNTLTYDTCEPELCDDFRKDMEWVKKQDNLYLFFREIRSFEIVHKYYPNSYLSPDMALYWNHVKSYTNKPKKRSDRILLCLRDDCERMYDIRKDIENTLKMDGIEFDCFDICTNEYIDQTDGRKLVEFVMNLFSDYKCVITDRLHAVLISAITSVPCIAFDNLTKKISGVYEWIKEYEYIRIIDCGEKTNLKHHIESVCDVGVQKEFKPLNKEFESMAITIANIIGY